MSIVVPPVDLAPSLPSRIVTVKLTDLPEGGLIDAPGWIEFVLPGDLRVPANDIIVRAGSVRLNLDASGEGQVRLPVHNPAAQGDGVGGDWYLLVRKSWTKQVDMIRVPAGSGSISLAKIAPVVEVTPAMGQWLITNAAVELVEGAAWGVTVTTSGGVARFKFTVPPGGEAFSKGLLTGSDSIDNLTDGVYQVRASSVVTALGLPAGASGSLWIHRVNSSGTTAFRVWQPTNSPSTYEQRVHGGTVSEWVRTRWEDDAPLTSSSALSTLHSGAYKVLSTSVATDLGLPVISAGSLLVYHLNDLLSVRIWRPTNAMGVWEQRVHNGVPSGWISLTFATPVALTDEVDIGELESGLYPVRSSAVATTLGLPGNAAGSLWVHRVSSEVGRMEWRPATGVDVWHKRRHGDEWSDWLRNSGGLGGPGGPGDPGHPGDPQDPGESSLTLQDTGQSMIPMSVGIDGYLYGATSAGDRPVRSADALATAPESGPLFSQFTSSTGSVVHVERTSAGYVVIWQIGSQHNQVWFSDTWDGPYSMVLDFGPWHFTSWAKPRTIAGVTWMLIAEYTNALNPSQPLRRFLSTDGGATWEHIRSLTVNDPARNAHCHTGLIRADGRIFVSDGDGPNQWFGYSDDRGRTWVPVNIDGSQPTLMVDFGDIIATSPDGGPVQPGIWWLDPHTARFGITWELEDGGPYNNAAEQYGRSRFAQGGPTGREAYVMFPPGSSTNRETYIVATADAGRRWGVVATVPLGASGTLNSGVVGPDLNGNLYMRGTELPTYGSNVIKAPLIYWE